jgi:broad-specificity NMP kinase
MLIAIIGENCVGKTTLANKINEQLGATIYAGKDYLRLEKNPSTAAETFKATLKASIEGSSIIYLITEKEHIQFLPEGAFRIVLTAELEEIKERFKARMRGNLPMPVEKMLEAKHGMYDSLACNLKLDGNYNMEDVFSALSLK